MASQDYDQYAYVTTDWQRAMRELGEQHDIGGWMDMAEAAFDTGPGKTAVCHFALADKNNLQFEVIQPLDAVPRPRR